MKIYEEMIFQKAESYTFRKQPEAEAYRNQLWRLKLSVIAIKRILWKKYQYKSMVEEKYTEAWRLAKAWPSAKLKGGWSYLRRMPKKCSLLQSARRKPGRLMQWREEKKENIAKIQPRKWHLAHIINVKTCEKEIRYLNLWHHLRKRRSLPA